MNLVKEGGEKFEEEITARFLLIIDLEERHEDGEAFTSDLVEFCGVRQREIQSEDILDALEKIKKIEEWDSTLKTDKRGVVQDEWDAYAQKSEPKLEPGSLQCTFVLEPMIADFSNLPGRTDTAQTLSTLMGENVRFSRGTLCLHLDSTLKADEFLAKKTFGQLVASVFDSTRRYPELAIRKNCFSELKKACNPLQIGTLVVYCDPSLKTSEFEALCSAMAVSQTTKRLCLSLWLDPKDAISSTTKWKWLAYALFSKRARESSTLESLTLNSIGSMSIADMKAFIAMLTSEHPEEELFSLPRGQGHREKRHTEEGSRDSLYI